MSSYCFRNRHDLPTCIEARELPLCADCALTVAIRFDRLAHNLAIGAALCRSFDLGRDWELIFRLGPGNAFKRRAAADAKAWFPGCGRPTP